MSGLICEEILTEKDAALLGVLQLAFVGDTVYDLYVRSRLVTTSLLPMKQMHREAVALVNAQAQAEALARIETELTETEKGIVRRARNAKQRTPRNANPAHYHQSTGFEALLGFLYLSGQKGRLSYIVMLAMKIKGEL